VRKKKKVSLTPCTKPMQPPGNHSDKPERLGSSRAEVVPNSWEGEAGKGTSFAAGENICLTTSLG